MIKQKGNIHRYQTDLLLKLNNEIEGFIIDFSGEEMTKLAVWIFKILNAAVQEYIYSYYILIHTQIIVWAKQPGF